MEYQEIYDVVKQNSGKKFIITYAMGKVEKRLFISTAGDICEFIHRSRTRGRVISVYGICAIVPKLSTDVTGVNKCRNNLKNVVKYLTASGFWSPMLNGAKYFLSLTDDELLSLCNWDRYHKTMDIVRENGGSWFGYDCFACLFSKSIKTMNFHKCDREFQKKLIADNIANKKNCSYRWTNGYDNSYEVRFDNDVNRAWYSEEYRGCANGHYYYLLDNCHAIFGEHD